MITETCQRFTEHRATRRPAGETIRTSEYEVEIIDRATARAFVEAHHYAGSCSPQVHTFGFYRRGELVGVAVFGPLPSMNAHRAVFPTLSVAEGVTLGRFVLVDQVAGNGESYFGARCFELLRAAGIVAVDSCADPQPRETVEGKRVHRGHVGCIYQATNGTYRGLTNPSTLRLLPDATVFSNRASGKVARGEQGRAYAGAELVRWGADPLASGEDPREWLELWRARLTRAMRHRGNHRYLWCLDPKRRSQVIPYGPTLAYPKIGWAA